MSTGDSHIMPTYNRAELRFVRGAGAWLETEAGETYLDFGSGVAVNTLGHAHPKLNQPCRRNRKSCGTFPISTKFPNRKNWPTVCAPRALPIWCFSVIPARKRRKA